ncbi:MAG: DMT family transporter [bacterium]|nr:DMT family transporter [bacterium]
MAAAAVSSRHGLALLLGTTGVVAFSVTLPATRAAVPYLGGTFVGLGRAVVAAVLAAIVLAVMRERLPERRHWGGLAVVALGVVVGFPLLSAIALQSLPSAHSAVVIGLLPAATAVMAVLRAHERPSLTFWAGCTAGVVAVLIFAAVQGAGRPRPGDALLLGAVVLGALGYAEGGRISREIGGWRVISWALILSAPLLVVPTAIAARDIAAPVPAAAWLGFAYVSAISMYLGFFAWYRGLALGGVARIGQIQLIQPVLTLVWSVLLLGEHVNALTVVAALLVLASAAVAQRTRAGDQSGGSPSSSRSATIS